jgi:outer membrane protein assembly factor BamB
VNPSRKSASPALRGLLALAFSVVLGACSSSPQKPKPAELPANANLLAVRQAWKFSMGEVSFPLDVKVSGQTVALASSDGTVNILDARTGESRWRAAVGEALAAGVGYDGLIAAVMTRNNELVAMHAGRELWRQRLPAPGFTAPLVAGERVFILTADRTVTAFDGQTGRRIWSQQRQGEPLVLRQAGVLLAVGDTLVAGLSGKLVGMNPLNGSVRWEAPVASPRGTNDVERLVDMVAHVSRQGNMVCARAFQAAIGCVDAARGTLLWSKPAAGSVGVGGDGGLVFGVESDSTLIAWKRADGERAWTVEQLRYRNLMAPLELGRAVVVGDDIGLLHFLSRTDGAPLTRVSTDGSAIVAAPVLAGDTLVAVTRLGSVFGFRPD